MSEFITFDQLREELRKKPDLVEVVRCRDCMYFTPGEEEPPIDWCDWFHDDVMPLGFCSWGERKSELDLIKEGIEYAKATYPNTMRLLEDA